LNKLNLFIPAAGFGERLRPITNHIPKPLLPILGKPVIETVIEKVAPLGFNNIGINMHYQWEMIRNWAETSAYADRITLFKEDDILGTGGALKNAESFLNKSVFLVYNADILSDIDPARLVEQHQASGNTVTLAVHSHELFNNVWLDDNGLLKFVGDVPSEYRKGLRKVAFTGIAVYSPSFLDILPPGRSSVVDAWLTAAKSGLKIGTLYFDRRRWSDIGTPAAYSAAIFDALKQAGEIIYIDPTVLCCDLDMGANTVIEKNSVIEGPARLANCIILPGSRVKKDSVIENAIVGPDFALDAIEQVSMPGALSADLIAAFLNNDPSQLKISLIGNGGSDRKYYRIKDGQKSAVILECSGSDPDYKRQLIYLQFFRKYSLPVPDLLSTDSGKPGSPFLKQGQIYALFEDLGDLSLYSRLKCVCEEGCIEALYRKVLDILISLHTTVTRNVSECPLIQSRVFDREHLIWETSYFMDRFVVGLREIEITNRNELNKEFSRLADTVASFVRTVLHRDFQSQNIMITKLDVPRLIDFQGARMGPPAYDLASILWDPYYRLEASMRDRLVAYYTGRMKDAGGEAFNAAAFLDTLLPCRLQRHMQALGAYGFLAKEKGKSYFLKYVPQALEYLTEEVETVKTEYPALYELVKLINEKTSSF